MYTYLGHGLMRSNGYECRGIATREVFKFQLGTGSKTA